ncbi:MAG: 2OG-Fe(II) oxygenase [Myxococcota bacterium]
MSRSLPRVLDADRLRDLALAHRASYAKALPFRHVVLDDFLPAPAAERILHEFPPPDTFRSESSLKEPRRLGKRRSHSEEAFPPFLRRVLGELCDDTFLDFVGTLSGIPDLLSDHDRAGALRHYGRGSRLGIHADANFHAGLGAFRRVNLILYLNRDWQASYRGDLELWNERLTGCQARIAPAFNRAVLFDVHDRAFHGFPDALRCPRGTTRKTIQLYYYTREPAEADARPHGTLFHWRDADRWHPHRLWHAAYHTLRRRRSR